MAISQVQLAAWLLFAVEPTDRALTGWCIASNKVVTCMADADRLLYLPCAGGY